MRDRIRDGRENAATRIEEEVIQHRGHVGMDEGKRDSDRGHGILNDDASELWSRGSRCRPSTGRSISEPLRLVIRLRKSIIGTNSTGVGGDGVGRTRIHSTELELVAKRRSVNR